MRASFLDVAIYVAGYPEKESEIEFTQRKIDCGINACITQICFDSTKLQQFKEKFNIPVLPGLVLPTEKSLAFSSKLGIEVPNVHDPTAFLHNQVKSLISAGFRHLHFYTLNNLDNLLFLFYDTI